LAYWLTSRRTEILKLTTTSTHGTRRFDMKELFDVPIALPKNDEQREIVRRLDSSQAEIEATRKVASKLRLLKGAVMQELLTGKKRVTALLETGEHVAAEVA